ncbi:MAG: hypothetical protein VX949_00170 [Planctomycetota bacterium]|nr:hypothetical protein [Planctomycetota bacterium]
MSSRRQIPPPHDPSPPGDLGEGASDRDRLIRLEQLASHVRGEVASDVPGLEDSELLALARSTIRDRPLARSEIKLLSLNLERIRVQILRFLSGELERSRFHDWVCEMLKISITMFLASESPRGQTAESALGLLALIVDDDFTSPDSSRRLCQLVLDRIEFRQSVPCRRAISEMLRELGEVSLSVCERGPCTEDPSWVDISLLPRHLRPESRPGVADTWFQPLSVSTCGLWRQISPNEPWANRENDRVPALISEDSSLEKELEGLQLFLDPGGLTEAVVSSTRLGTRELRRAVSGFRLLHQMRRCYLDGIPVHFHKEDL